MDETATRWLTPVEQVTWRSFLAMHRAVMGRLHNDLAQVSGLSLAEFAVLVQLSEHVEGRMRVLELSRALEWEKSRLSHQLRRMQERGLLERGSCAEDRRGAVVTLTEQGRATIEAASPAHVAAVRRHLFDALDERQVRDLGVMAEQVLAALGPRPDGECVASGPDDCDAAQACGPKIG